MKRFFALIFVILPTFANAEGDIFDNHIWYNENYSLHVTKTDPWIYYGQTYDHAVERHGPDGIDESDACFISSPTTISCLAFSVDYDTDNHVATFTDKFHNSYTYS